MTYRRKVLAADGDSIVGVFENGPRAKLPEYNRSVELNMDDEPTIDWYIDKAIKEHHGISELQLAQLLGVSRATVSHWRTKKAWPSDLVMMRLADYAGVNQDDAVLHLSFWRAKSPAVKKLWTHILGGIYALKDIPSDLAIALVLFLGLTAPAMATEGEQMRMGASRSTYYAIFALIKC